MCLFPNVSLSLRLRSVKAQTKSFMLRLRIRSVSLIGFRLLYGTALRLYYLGKSRPATPRLAYDSASAVEGRRGRRRAARCDSAVVHASLQQA